jgi:hypothetical protein
MDRDTDRQGHRQTGTQTDRDTKGQGQRHKRTGKRRQTDLDRDMDTEIDNFNGQFTKNKNVKNVKL